MLPSRAHQTDRGTLSDDVDTAVQATARSDPSESYISQLWSSIGSTVSPSTSRSNIVTAHGDLHQHAPSSDDSSHAQGEQAGLLSRLSRSMFSLSPSAQRPSGSLGWLQVPTSDPLIQALEVRCTALILLMRCYIDASPSCAQFCLALSSTGIR